MNHDSGFDELLAALLLIVVLVVAGVWAGVHLAALVDAGAVAPVSIGDAARATIRLLGGNAAEAWNATPETWFPPTAVYWTSTAITTAATTLAPLAVWTRRSGPKVGAKKRTPLGVPAEARLARLRDLRPILVPGPVPGRFILGTVKGRLVATESRTAPTQWWRRNGGDRRADRSAVAVIGPQRSGKTVNVISGILEWDGPAILSSVRDDLFANTWQNRASKGPVYVFDPFKTLGPLPDEVTAISWSPLQISDTVAGAMEAAAVLLEAAPIEGTTNATYWSKKGEALLWPLLFAAASGNKTMADVVRWLAVQDGMHPTPSPKEASGSSANFRGEVRQKLEELIVTGEDSIKSDAEQALRHFEGFELLDSRTRSDIYSTSQTLVQPWEDPRIAHASSPEAGPPIDLEMLLDGGTLYVVQPLKNADRFSVVFGGLLGALVKDEAYEWSHTHRRLLPDLLVVIDEAGNTPLQWLPAVASTCSGVGILLVTVWQSKAQIDALYQRQADPLLTNHGSKIFFAGASDEATLNYISWLCGDEEVAVTSANRDISGTSLRRSLGESPETRALVPPAILRQAKPGQGLLVHGTLPAAHVRSLHHWSKSIVERHQSG